VYRLCAVVLAGGLSLGAVQAGPARAAFPGSNGRLVFSSDRAVFGGRPAVYSVDVDGRGRRALSAGAAGSADLFPAISPDGSRIAFLRLEGARQSIWVMAEDGTGQRKLADAPSDRIDPTFSALEWSPDGTRLATTIFSRCPPRPGAGPNCVLEVVVVLDLRVGGMRVLTGGRLPSWSADGQHLAYMASSTPYGEAEELYVARTDGSAERAVAAGDDIAEVSWSPVGHRLAYVDGGYVTDKTPTLHVLDVIEAPRLLRRPVVGHSPAWSADGKALAFVRGGAVHRMNASGTTKPQRIVSGDDPRWSGSRRLVYRAGGLHAIGVNGLEDRRIAGGERLRVGWYSLSRDGRSVAFAGQVVPPHDLVQPFELYAVEPDGHGLRRLTQDRLLQLDPAVARNGRIAFSRPVNVVTTSGGVSWDYAIAVRTANGGAEQLLTRPPRASWSDHEPAWSPDGKSITFVRRWRSAALGGRVMVMRAGGSPARALTRDVGDSVRDPAWSPDGDRIVFSRGGTITVMHDDGTWKRPLIGSDADPYQHPSWSPDSRSLAFASGNGRGIHLADAYTGSLVRILGERSADYPRWSPDGRRIAFFSHVGLVETISVWGEVTQEQVWALMTTDPDGTDVTELLRVTGAVAGLDWQRR
jgi:Tol biopolymer transport system component